MLQGLKKGDALTDITSSIEYFVVDSQLVDGCIALLDRSSREPKFWPLHEVYEGISQQRIKLHRADTAFVPVHAHDSPAFLQRLNWATKCLRQVLDTTDELGMSFDRAFHLVRDEHRGQPFPTRSSMYRFKARHLAGLPVLKGDKNKGCRKARYQLEVYELITQHAPLYCSPHSRWQMPAFVRFINQQARDKGYIEATQSVSLRHVRDTLKQQGYIDTGSYRMERKNVAAARSMGARRIHTTYPFERVEMDGVHLPFLVQTDHGVSSNIWCVHAIEVKTGMVLGWKLVVGSPSENDGLDCIQSMLFSKKTAFRLLGLNYSFDIYGTPGLIVFDNGAEGKGERMEKLLLLGIDTEHCPARHPHKKPYIERLNRSLKTALETLPGCTRMDGIDGKRTMAAERETPLSLLEIEQFMVRWYYEQWGNQTLERHQYTDPECGVTPMERWKYFTETSGHVMPIPVTQDEWRKVTLVRSQRKLSSKTGITYEGLSYKGSNLPHLLQRFHEAPVSVYADPRDYRFIYVDDGSQLVELAEEFVHSDSPAFTLEQCKVQRKALREQLKPGEASQFERDIWSQSLQTTTRKTPEKTAQRNRTTAKKHKESQAIQRAIAKPLKASSLLGESVNKVHDATMTFDNLPTFDVVDRRNEGGKA
ncbi:DDE-type integrase/transposase/recombinase [Comamonas sp. 26]|uniref:DDE-type integrase/transposase/recombinase n=1 Tax=Comamonas sp. 26 TaxID=2035201 RepID=UPI000C18A4FB|nr:DDE-type integrase/transposase/recombinase [Comamonas sp. 26]PIF98479.1 putative transposase [Comamonas sp. 26]